jgi:hypothetical protein
MALPPTLPPLLYKLLLTMTQDHRTSQESLAVQASRATGTLAGQRPAPRPCGAVARLPRQFVVIDGVRLSVTDPCFGSGPSSAPACPDPNTHVRLQGAWRIVLTETYAAAAGSHTGTPLTANRTTRVAALSTNPANPAAAAAPPLPLLMLLQLQHLVPRLQMRLSRPAGAILGLAASRLAKTGMRTVGVIR